MTVGACTGKGLSHVDNFLHLLLRMDLTKVPIVQRSAPSEH